MPYMIKSDEVIFENAFLGSTVVLKNSKSFGNLEFGSPIKFTFGAEFNQIEIGEYSIQIETTGDLSIKKNGLSLLKLNS